MSARWVGGNAVTLLENGEAFFPRVFEVIDGARQEILIETFILFEDKVGCALQERLIAAARRGVEVHLHIDGYGSPDLSPAFLGALDEAGVKVHVFDPGPRLFGRRVKVLRRMHRKIVVIDGERAFIGGINYSADHLADFGPQAKQDYAIEVEGPIVAHVHHFARVAIRHGHLTRRYLRHLRRFARSAGAPLHPEVGPASAMLVTRDNRDHTTDIERHYRAAIRLARHRLIIANAYFFPGYRLIKELRRAARRGVDVTLILQGEPDMPIVKFASSLLYDHLLRAGVKIFEYCERPLHGKVALVDDEWATVGSSNLDPLSLSMNLEANLMIRDRGFNQVLSDRLDHLLRHNCKQVVADPDARERRWPAVRSALVFHFLRRFPFWASLLPTHAPKVAMVRS